MHERNLPAIADIIQLCATCFSQQSERKKNNKIYNGRKNCNFMCRWHDCLQKKKIQGNLQVNCLKKEFSKMAGCKVNV